MTKDFQGLMKFEWFEKDARDAQDSLTVFPDDCKFEKVKQTQDRVYLLEMKATEQRFFYWMQEDDKDKDEERCKQIHNTLNNIQ